MNKNIPDTKECLSLLEEYGTPPHVIAHCQGVCKVAVSIANRLNQVGYDLDIPLISASCMLHDIARVHEHHEAVGAYYLREKGYEEVADVIEQHTHYRYFNDVKNLKPIDLLCIGDRTVKEDEYVGVDERLEYIKQKAIRSGRVNFVDGIEKSKIVLKTYIATIETAMGITLDELMKG